MIGESLKNMMKEKNVNSTQLSKYSGVSKSNISQFRSNKSTPSLKVFFKLADTLMCSTDELRGNCGKTT